MLPLPSKAAVTKTSHTSIHSVCTEMAFLVCFWVEKEQTSVKYIKPGETKHQNKLTKQLREHVWKYAFTSIGKKVSS